METQTMSNLQLPEVNATNVQNAIDCIKSFADRRKLVLTGNTTLPSTVAYKFSSMCEEKRFKWSMLRITKHQTMKGASLFFSKLYKATGIKITLDYSAQEKSIKSARKEWKELSAKAEEALAKYKTLKGDFYKS